MHVRPLLLALVVLGALAGCNDDGRTLTPAPPTTASTAVEVPPTSEPAEAPAGSEIGLRLTSPDLSEGALLDERFTCNGPGTAPALVFGGIPPAAAELAVVVVDLDADGYVHWAVAGLPPTTVRLGPGSVPAGAVVAPTDGGVRGWEGPCPPEGDAPHRYEVRLYVMAEPIGLATDLEGRDAVDVIDAAAIDVARLTVRYGAPSTG